MRRPFIAGNWKMNLDRAAAAALARGIAQRVGDESQTEVALCPPAVYLESVAEAVAGSAVGLGGQNMYHEGSGAYTGEISGPMLLDLGCKYVILGHSERRHVFGESDEDVNRKVHAALDLGLTPIVCVGELLQQREAGETKEVIQRQLFGSMAGVSDDQITRCVLAYEPVWAIGTGKTATPDQAEEVHSDLRKLLESRYNRELAAEVRILYGGSVKPENAAELLAQPNIDGALVGGASLEIDSFLAIIEAA